MTTAPTASDPAGLRERKKQQTRDAISRVATELFARRGFEKTTIAEVAAAADVAKMTVTNYFPLKEDLVFDRAETISDMLAGAVTTRSSGQSVLDAISAAYADALNRHDPILGFLGVQFAEMVEGSPALRSRERDIFAQQETRLAELLATEFATAATDVRLRIAAAELAAVFRILYYEARRRLMSGEDTGTTVRALRRAARASFDIVAHGLPPELTV